MESNKLYDLLVSLNLQQLRQRGNNFFACCPSGNHTDRRPSWGISLTAPHYHGCFACEYKGVLSTLLVTAGYSVRQAKIVSGEGEHDTHDFQFGKKKQRDIIVFENDAIYPFYPTVRSDTYFRLRGLSMATIRKANLLHDVRANRVLFPWYRKDDLVALVGRALNWKQIIEGPKMLNYLPESMKRSSVYLPGREIKRGQPLVCVEGEVDALRIFNLNLPGFTVCALGHSQLSNGQRDLMLNSGASEFWAVGDDDKAGRKLNFQLQKYLANHAPVKVADYAPVRKNYAHLKKDLDPGCLEDDDLALLLQNTKGKYFPRWQ